MKPTMIVGLVLTILGVGLLFWQGVVFFTTREPVVQAGPVTVWGTVEHAIWLGPIVGAVVLAAGLVMLLMGAARQAR